MKKTIFLYGLSLAGLVILLKFFEYRLFVRDYSWEIYAGLVAVLFTTLGIWVGRKITYRKDIADSPEFKLDQVTMDRLGISKREQEVLELISRGFSNQEIADRLFVSVNTVKNPFLQPVSKT